MRMFNKCLAGVVVAVTCFAAQAVTRLEVDSYGGQGPDPYAYGVPWVLYGTQSFTPADGFIYVERPYLPDPYYANTVNVSFFDRADTRDIEITFSTDRQGVPLTVGFYPGAQRFPFNQVGHPGLDFSDTGGGFNTLNGQFHVYDIKSDAKGVITAFAASFEIFGPPAPLNATLIGGRIWYNSDAVIPSVPEANSGLLLAIGLSGVLAVAASKSRRSRRLQADTPASCA